MAQDPNNNQSSNPFANPRKTGPEQQPDLEKFGHEGVRGYLMRIGQPKIRRNFTHDMMNSIKKGTNGN